MEEKKHHIDHEVAMRSLERGLNVLATSLLWIEKDSQEYKRVRKAQWELYCALALVQGKAEKKA